MRPDVAMQDLTPPLDPAPETRPYRGTQMAVPLTLAIWPTSRRVRSGVV